jgi:hypothetical protein
MKYWKPGMLHFEERTHPAPDGNLISGSLENEDPRWLQLIDGVVSVNSAAKATVQAQDAADAVVDAKTNAITNEYNTLNGIVIGKVQTDLFANSTESATANYLQLVMMMDDPTFFSDKGLLAEVDVKAADLITKIVDKGEALNTDLLVTNYATRLIQIAKEYAVYRHQKKDEFRAYKDSL